MLYSYGFSQRGKLHEKMNIECQDAYKICINDELAIAAVADGLGSEKYSGIASQIAVDIVVDFCKKNISTEDSEEQILDKMCVAFTSSLTAIEKRAADDKHNVDQYDTTLCLCILKNGTLYYGQSGDSGAIAYTDIGTFINVTEQQRDEEGRVFPLCFGKRKWKFGKINERVSGALLATDGIYDTFFPIYIRNKQVNIYTALAMYFLDNEKLQIEKYDMSEIQSERYKYIENIPENVVGDDKTIAVILDSSIEVNKQPIEYYQEPDWELLRKEYIDEFNKKAYPNLDMTGDKKL